MIPDIIFLWRTQEHTTIAFPLAFRAIEDLEPDYEKGKVMLKIVHTAVRFPKVHTGKYKETKATLEVGFAQPSLHLFFACLYKNWENLFI